MATNAKVNAVKRHTGALDRYYMKVCPGCSMPSEDCKNGSTNELACILADVREVLLRIEAKIDGGKTDAEH